MSDRRRAGTDRDDDGRPVEVVEPGFTHRDLADRERAVHGGIKWGSAFFGWLTATGLSVLLTAAAAAIGAAVGLSQTASATDAAAKASENAGSIGLAGGIALVVILFVSYYCGGYVAGRMARFSGMRQGMAVWVWAIVVALVVAVVAAVAGSRYDVLGSLNSFPRIPVRQADLTTGGLVAVAVFLVVSLVGAMLGGAAGMRYHRMVDRTALAD